MAVFLFNNRGGMVKPPMGSRPDPEHPFMDQHLMSVLFDGAGTFPLWITRRGSGKGWKNLGGALFGGPEVLVGGATPPRASSILDPYNSVGCSWQSNQEGRCLALVTAFNTVNLGSSAFLPTKNVTILAIRRLTAVTSNARLFRNAAADSHSTSVHAYVPYAADSKIYWRWGGNAGANNLGGAAGVAGVTANPDRLIFQAGDPGSAVWVNGVKVLSQTTAISRTASTDNFFINGSGAADGGFGEFNFFMVIGKYWPDELCRWWSAQPYDHLQEPDVLGRSFFFAGGGEPAVTSALTGSSTTAGQGSLSTEVATALSGEAATSGQGSLGLGVSVGLSSFTMPVLNRGIVTPDVQTAQDLATPLMTYRDKRRGRTLL